MRRFVQVALEPLDMDLVHCATVAEAKTALSDRTTRLVITDLNLPDGTGLELLAWIKESPSPQLSSCICVVFSGDIQPVIAKTLKSLAVWRVLNKPTSVGALVSCVTEALSIQAGEQAEAPFERQDPVWEFFGGNRTLFETYQRACLAQFPQDLQDGDAADRAQDATALRRVAHNLKSVLAMLGEACAAQWARDTEEWAACRQIESMHAGWLVLRKRIETLIASPNH